MRLPLAAYDTGAGASDPKTNKHLPRQRFGEYNFALRNAKVGGGTGPKIKQTNKHTDHDMKQTKQTTTLATIDLPRQRFGEYNFINLGTPAGQTASLHTHTQDHVLSCSATKK